MHYTRLDNNAIIPYFGGDGASGMFRFLKEHFRKSWKGHYVETHADKAIREAQERQEMGRKNNNVMNG
jgi:hypothetical protein